MALLTSQPISRLAVALLRRQLVLPNTVIRVPAGEYSGPSGGTVTVRVPVPREAKEQTTPGAQIAYVDAEEIGVDVQVKHFYDGVLITDETLSLELEDFGRQILLPQVASVAERAEAEIAGVMNSLPATGEVAWPSDPDAVEETETVVLAARELLTQNGAPAGGRYLAVSPDVATKLLKVDKFSRVDARGSSTALDEAILGRIYGLTVVESAALEPGSAVAYHESAFAFGNAAPAAPGGGADSSTAQEGGVSLRHVLAFDPSHLSTASVVSVFAGASVVAENAGGDEIKRAVRITGATSS
jgi:hypothetical protein